MLARLVRISTWALLCAGCASSSTHAPPGQGGAGESSVTSAGLPGWGGLGGRAAVGGGGGASGEGGERRECTVRPGQLDARDPCEPLDAPANIQLVEKWRFPSPALGFRTVGHPLVANMTDDDGDGRVNMCDIPDVVACSSIDGDLFDVVVLSGANGELLLQLFAFDTDQAFGECSLAVADLQNDGTPDLITMSRSGVLRAITPDGAVLWQGSVPVFTPATDEYDPTQAIPAALFEQSQPAVHDLESDGLPEILIGLSVYNSDGTLRFRDPTQGTEFADGYVVGDPTPDWRLVAWAPILPTIADLDGDGTAEVLFGHVTYRSDGAEMWRLDPAIGPVIPHPADFDGDGETEILAVSRDGLLLLSSGGEVLWGPIRPPENGVPPRFDCWIHPAAIADMDNDGLPEAIVNSCEHRLVLDISDAGVQVLRAEPVPITTVFGAPWSGSVAFDFRGSGEDWLAYHHQGLTLFDGTGSTVMSQVYADSSGEGPTYPVVADVDNDGSADVVINDRSGVVVYEDVFQRPSPARRIWNQWNYVANSVREDGLVVSPVADGSIGQRVQRPLACVP